MSKRDNLMDYIFTTPGNMNPVILNQKIDETVSEEGSGETPTGTITITENDTYDVTEYASAEVNVTSDYSAVQITFINVSEYAYNVVLPKVANEKMSYVELSNQIEVEANSSASIDLVVYKNSAVFAINSTDIDTASAITTTGGVEYDSDNGIVIVSGNGTISGSGTQPW